MNTTLILTGLLTVVGVTYFLIDLYRQRSRLSKKPIVETDFLNSELGMIPDEIDLHPLGKAIGECSHDTSNAVEHCAESIANLLSHH